MNRSRLIISQIPHDFDPQRDIPIAPFCFVGKEYLFPDWENSDFYEPLTNAADIEKMSHLITRFVLYLIGNLGAKLNEMQGLNRSYSYWKTILLPWAIVFVESNVDHCLRVKEMVRRHEHDELEVTLHPNLGKKWLMTGALDYYDSLLYSFDFNKWLYSIHIERHAPAKWNLVRGEEKAPSAEPVSSPAVQKPAIGLGSQFRGFIQRMSRCGYVYGFKSCDDLFFALYLLILPAGREGSLPKNEVAPGWEDDFRFFQEMGIDWESFAFQTIPQTCLSVREVERRAISFLPWRRAGKLDVGHNLAFDEESRFRMADALEKGEKLICVQHGGGYGNSLSRPFHAAIEYRQHAFITWGWTRHGRYPGTFVPLPSPLLGNFFNKYKRRTDALILVGGLQNTQLYRYDTVPSVTGSLRQRVEKVRFINTLSQGPRKELRYRPYPDKRNMLKDAEYLNVHAGSISLVEGDFHAALLGCRLLAIDHPGTTLNIALVANIPTLCFWRPDEWAMCEDAKGAFEGLAAAGILHETAEGAADMANRIWGNIEEWWGQDAVQGARKAWLAQNGLTGKGWRLKWLKALWNLR